jgi:hypothetical protein
MSTCCSVGFREGSVTAGRWILTRTLNSSGGADGRSGRAEGIHSSVQEMSVGRYLIGVAALLCVLGPPGRTPGVRQLLEEMHSVECRP